MDTTVRIIVAMLVVGGIWLAIRPKYAFLVRIRDGVPHVVKGRLTATHVKDIADVLQSAEITRGWVAGTRRSLRTVLVFSSNIPKQCRQQLRNLWVNQ